MSNPIPLDLFEPNPWQTRQGVDEGYIAELVDDIRRNGLLQDPLGRLVKGGEPLPIVEASRVSLEGQAMKRGGITVQLAFGHNRLAAYQRLHLEHGASWSAMPVQVRYLSDEMMADYAWAENERRQDLSPIERAQAVQKRIESFGWTHEQVADHLGLSRPTISNILRLLELPDDLKQTVSAGQISERAALALLPMTQLPEKMIERANQQPTWYESPKKILENAGIGGVSSLGPLMARQSQLIEENTAELLWRIDVELMADGLVDLFLRTTELLPENDGHPT